ncbi:MAG: hypothetical protein E7591_03295 [Ruminococcaceae bacterium]|nr:hypothetical protein [Oscillospiraceae bacterium]
MRIIEKRFSVFAIVLLLIFLPLYVENAYFNVVEAKFRAFFISSMIIVLPITFFLAYRLVKRKEYNKKPLDLSEGALLGFAAVWLISCLLSERRNSSFWGNDGWYIGVFAVLMLTLLYFFLSRSLEYEQNIFIPVFAINVLIFILGILQFARIDLFGLHENILEKQYYQYISTLGNTNWVAGYLCLFIPMSFVFFLNAEDGFSYIFNLIFLIFAFSNLILSISDGAYIGLGFSAFFSIPFIFNDKLRSKRCLLLFMIFFAEAVLITLLPCFNGLFERISGISSFVLDLRISAPLLAFCVLTYILISLSKREGKEFRRVICIACEVLLLLIVIGFFIYSVITFDDSFGSSRGAIWRVSFERFSDYSVKEKLIGIGPELLRGEYRELQMSDRFKGLAILSSHSEPIQILLSSGIIGLALYLTVLAGVFKDIGRISEKSFAYFLPISAYFGQSFVNSATIVNLTLLCIIFSMYRISKKTTA